MHRRPSLTAWIAILLSVLSMAAAGANWQRSQDMRYIGTQLQSIQEQQKEMILDVRELRRLHLEDAAAR